LNCTQFGVSDYRRQKQVSKADNVQRKKEPKRGMKDSPPFPKQQQSKPGSEAELDLPPLFDRSSPWVVRTFSWHHRIAPVIFTGEIPPIIGSYSGG
jgi:hypothetical protein